MLPFREPGEPSDMVDTSSEKDSEDPLAGMSTAEVMAAAVRAVEEKRAERISTTPVRLMRKHGLMVTASRRVERESPGSPMHGGGSCSFTRSPALRRRSSSRDAEPFNMGTLKQMMLTRTSCLVHVGW